MYDTQKSVGTTSPESARRSTARYAKSKEGRKRLKHKWAVQSAIRSGKLKKPKACSRCGRTGVPLMFHHTDTSYKEGSQLKGRFVCAKCHSAIDPQRSGSKMKKARRKAEYTKKREGTYHKDGSKSSK